MTLKTIEQNEIVCLYSISFDGNDKSEFERFLAEFKDNARLNKDFQTIQILIIGNGGEKTTRTYQEDEKLSGYVLDLQKFDKLLKEARKSGNVKVENNIITGIDKTVFEI